MINYNTPNLIIACYPPGAGGKFLLNCLGLSQGVVLQDQMLATKQLNGELSSDDKFELLIDRLEYTKNVEKQWTDLNLGCCRLFGKNYKDIDITNITNDIILRLSYSDTMFPVVGHSLTTTFNLSKLWPNAKILQLVNETNFIKTIRPYDYPDTVRWHRENIPNLWTCWDNIRDESWQKFPPMTVAEYYSLPSFIIDEDHCVHNDVILKEVIEYEAGQIKLTHDKVEWNCDWFLDSDIFLQQIKNLYSHFNLKDLQQDKLSMFRKKWLECLIALRDLD